MPRSMTAYARETGMSPLGKLVIELHSVNRKGFDLNMHMPKEFICFDMDLRKRCGEMLERGQVTLRLAFYKEGVMQSEINPLLNQLKALKITWETIAKELGIDQEQAEHLPFLVSQLQPASCTFANAQEEKAMKEALCSLLTKALESLVRMKEEEGQHLVEDMRQRLVSVEKALQKVAKKKEEHLQRYREKLRTRIQECTTLDADAEGRIEKEIVLLADKMDITEELVRLESLSKQMHDRFQSKESAVGKAMDFLVQEMQRETHTLGVKAIEAGISPLVIDMKSTLEKIREQVQNIE